MLFSRKHSSTEPLSPKAATAQLVSQLAQFMKEAGFKKSGNIWNKSYPHFSAVVSIQGNRWNHTGEEISVAINIGLFVPAVYTAIHNEAPRPPFKEYDSIYRMRLTPDSSGDHWWSIAENNEITSAAREICELLQLKTFPFFESIQTLDDLITLITTGQHAYGYKMAGIICAAHGDKVRAKQLFTRAITLSDIDTFSETVRVIAAKYDIDISQTGVEHSTSI